MIRYSLRCKDGHRFESWFQNAAGFVALQTSGQLACPLCGGAEVEKELMAPSLRPARQRDGENDAAGQPTAPPDLSAPGTEIEAAIAALRKQIAENSEYVGMNFAAEARRIHAGAAPERAIYGEARPEDARSLIEDGLPVAPLPFLPTRKVN
ncbi:DUF1178 family protein [Tabrizicola sp.]|uniref:DUF1178 family protein n=1 Tax=Tabrizicola sp. TaxID=2005166 RepID=UPI002606932F|nr:DUF1178 family protein [Tabrizicola sp.]MDM7932037.1 DUF1178 family protein [Tabrizicola sp.]